ncbi:AMP-binding protein [Vibrio sp. CK2-1]|uniref:AMP-binding protein n=1 Tax=Vibrio sp. CK2-1 TaxID=2912249 RepID=UPI001F411912|nr:AMP-binding protein [Vibrio sp. CK2-1]MCF7355627.1 AMP-binding protein [Vibrio sp. CK2-1]
MKNIQFNHDGIISQIKRIPESRVYLTTKEVIYTYRDVKELSENFIERYPHLSGSTCAIITSDRESLALYLPAINSICHSLLLLPKCTDNSVKQEFYTSADVDYVIHLSQCEVSEIEDLNNNPKCRNNEPPAYFLATSGTTGTPKLASYRLESLLSTTKMDIDKGAGFIWGLSYDINRFAGLQVYLQSVLSGSTLVIPSSKDSMTELMELFSDKKVNALSATPSFWRKFLMDPKHLEVPLHRITLGGEISNQSILSALTQHYPSAAIVHIYASTEAGVGFSVKDKQEGFPLTYLTGDPKSTCQLKIVAGNLWIKSSNGCSKFVNAQLDIDEDGFINTGDMVKVENDRVIFLGRENGSINVGGSKVMPEKVESILEQHPSVLMAKVYPKSNPVLGSLVVCDVVISEIETSLSLKELKSDILYFCRGYLESFEVPALIKVVKSIETNATGKKVRN